MSSNLFSNSRFVIIKKFDAKDEQQQFYSSEDDTEIRVIPLFKRDPIVLNSLFHHSCIEKVKLQACWQCQFRPYYNCKRMTYYERSKVDAGTDAT